MQDPLMPPLAIQRGLISALVTGFVSGIMVSTTQWLVLKRYLPQRGWLLAGTLGYTLLTVSLEISWGWIGGLTTSEWVAEWFEQVAPAVVVFASSGLWVLITACCALWLGLAQWLFLRPFTRSNWWWMIVPAIAVFCAASFAVLSVLLLSAGVKLPLEINVLAAGILGLTQAIGLCSLKKRKVSLTIEDDESPLLLAPEIWNYPLVQTLAQQLHYRLNMAWTTEHLNDDRLSYLVGVTATGAIAAYTPMNRPALEQLHEIPLPELILADRDKHQHTDPLARFEVTFLPSGSLHVLSWCGVPLPRVTLSMLTAIFGLSAIVALYTGRIALL